MCGEALLVFLLYCLGPAAHGGLLTMLIHYINLHRRGRSLASGHLMPL